MTALGIWLAALGMADLVLAPAGRPGAKRAVPAAAVAGATGLVGGLLFGLPFVHAFGITVLAAAAGWGWFEVRAESGWSPRRAAFVLVGATETSAAMILIAPAWEEPSAGPVARWLDGTPFPLLTGTTPPRLALILGSIIVLFGTANAVVRLVLEAAETLPREREDPPLTGGRVIGVLERLLIFGFVFAGAPAAAALVASAKSVLRFPEISRSDATEIHVATEYFLVGSLTSWLLAVALAAVAAA